MPTSVSAIASPFLRRVAAVVALGLATGAFAALARFDLASANDSVAVPASDAKASPNDAADPPLHLVAPRVLHEPADVPPPAAVRVPDFSGDRVSKARRKAKALGLRLVARDQYGERVTSDFTYYRVRTQTVNAGTSVAPGTTVEIRARSIPSYAGGY